MEQNDAYFEQWAVTMNPRIVAHDDGLHEHFTKDLSYLWLDDKNIEMVCGKILQCSQCSEQTARRYANKKTMTEFIAKRRALFDSAFKGPHRPYLDLDIMVNDFVADACLNIKTEINLFGMDSMYNDTPITQEIPYRSFRARRRQLSDVEQYMYTHNTSRSEDMKDSYINLHYKRERAINPYLTEYASTWY